MGGWEIKKIGDVCDLMTGGTPSKKNPEYFDGGDVKWLVSGDIHKKEIKDCEGRITELGLTKSNAKYKGVLGLIALNGSDMIGAAWIRLYQKNNSIRGFIKETVPVLVIGIKKEYRNKGIGTEILHLLFEKATGKGIKSISLMVSEDNEAFKLYEKVGFELKEKHDDSLLMIKKLMKWNRY